jgi:hypothetical protein
MVETGNTIKVILGSVDVVIGAREFFAKVRQMGRWKQYLTRHYDQAKFGDWQGSRRFHRLENLNSIKINGWANSEVVDIIREQNAQIDQASSSRESHILLPVFQKLRAIINYGSLERHPLGYVHSSCEN